MNTLNKITILMFMIFGIKGYAQKKFNITDYGALGDGKTLNTIAIQKTIDKAAVKGGRVVIPPGKFLSGTIILKSGVDLWFDEKAILLGSTNPGDYKKEGILYGLLIANNQQRISVHGKGTIDGQGLALALTIDSLHHAGIRIDSNYNYRRMRPNNRPKIIDFVFCSQVDIRRVTIMNSSSWVQNYDRCEDLVIDSITVNSVAFWNNDGIDVSDSRNVTITNCFVNAADDGICLKSERVDKFNDNVYIANCTVRSSANGVKFGTSSVGGFKNIRIENINVYDTYRSAVALESVDGGALENVNILNINATNTGNAIFLRLGHRNKDGRNGTLKNITIKNVKVQVPFDRPDRAYDLRGPDLPFFHNPFPASVTGLPKQKIENVTFENIEISYPGRATKGMAYVPISRLTQVPEKEDEYPEFSMFGELPSWAFYVRHVNGITMKNIAVKLENADFRPAFVFDDVLNLRLSQLYFPILQTSPAIVMQHCADATITEDEILKKITIVEPIKK